MEQRMGRGGEERIVEGECERRFDQVTSAALK